MSDTQLALPYYQYVTVGGEPLFNAKIYVGIANTDPTNPANQIDVLAVQNGGVFTVIEQPIRTNTAGQAVDDVGNIVYPVVQSDYSIKVTDANDALLYEEANVTAGDSQAIIVRKFKLTVDTNGQTVFTLPAGSTTVSLVNVNQAVLQETSGEYTTDINAGTLTLTTGLNTADNLEVWVSSIPAAQPDNKIAAVFDTVSDMFTQDLNDIDLFATKNGLSTGDNFGATFVKTGFIDGGSAGSSDPSKATAYDIAGREFKQVGQSVSLETFGVLYAETSSTILTYISGLRSNGFTVNLNPRYELTTFPAQSNVNVTQKEIQAHRGYKFHAPENTLMAFSMAYNRTKAQNFAFEIDVQVTSDGIPVCFHDTPVDTLLDGTGFVKDLTYAQLRAMKFDQCIGTAFEDDVRVPTFDAVVQYAAYLGVKIYPEFKAYRTIADIELVNDIVRKYRYENNTVFTSFRLEDLRKLREYNQQSGVIQAIQGVLSANQVADVAILGSASIFRSIGELTGTPTDIDLIHSYGVECIGYTADRLEDMQVMTELGISKYLTDRNNFTSSDMTSVTANRLFNKAPWNEEKSGSATITYLANPQNNQGVGDIVDINANLSDTAYVKYPFAIGPSEQVQLQVFARNTGGAADQAQIRVVNQNNQLKDLIDVIGEDLLEYQITYQADYAESFEAYSAAFVLGATPTRAVNCRFYRPLVKSANSFYPANRVLMDGYLRVAAGDVANAFELEGETTSFNVDDFEIQGDSLQITPHTEGDLFSTNGTFHAKCHMTVSNFGQDTDPLIFTANSEGNQGKMFINAYSMVTGDKVPMNTISTEHRLYFKVEL